MTKGVVLCNQTHLSTRCLELAGMKFVIVPYFTTFLFVIRYSGKLLCFTNEPLNFIASDVQMDHSSITPNCLNTGKMND